MLKKIAIIGAGLSGALLAQRLQNKAIVTVFDKARGPGGRVSSLRTDNHSFDKGAQEFTVKDKQVLDVIKPALASGILSHWTPRFMNVQSNKQTLIEVPENRYFCGFGNLNQLAQYWLKDINCHYSCPIITLEGEKGDWFLVNDALQKFGPFDEIIMTQPAQQVLALAPEFESELSKITYNSCVMLYLGIDKALPTELADVYLSDETNLRWIIQNHKKPGNLSSPSLVLQSISVAHETLNRTTLSSTMLKECEALLGASLTITFQSEHYWRYAKCITPLNKKNLWNNTLGIGVIGDAFINKASSGIEAALLSAIHFSNDHK